jgi:hypothetical protein
MPNTTTTKRPVITIEDRVKFESIWNELKLVSHRVHTERVNDGHWFPCGHASLEIPNRGKFAQWLLESELASKFSSSGLTLRTYDRYGFAPSSQSYDLNVAIKSAMRDALIARGVKATMSSWVD